MHIDPLIEIILRLWDELPGIMGERWAAAEPMLALFLIRHDDAPDVETRNRTVVEFEDWLDCLLYTSPSPRD